MSKELRDSIKALTKIEKDGRKTNPAKPDKAALDAEIGKLTAFSAKL
jgi:hypothetical protein